MPPISRQPVSQLAGFLHLDWLTLIHSVSQGCCPLCPNSQLQYDSTSDPSSYTVATCDACGWSSLELLRFLQGYVRSTGRIHQAELAMAVLLKPIAAICKDLHRGLRDRVRAAENVESGPLHLRYRSSGVTNLSWSRLEQLLAPETVQWLRSNIPRTEMSYVQVLRSESNYVASRRRRNEMSPWSGSIPPGFDMF